VTRSSTPIHPIGRPPSLCGSRGAVFEDKRQETPMRFFIAFGVLMWIVIAVWLVRLGWGWST
jgi:hypothetical protein